MKTIILAAAAMIAVPLSAQTTPASPTTPDGVTSPSTPGTTQQTQGATPPPADASTPAPAAPADQSMAPTPATPADTAPAPAPSTGKLPVCRQGQYTGCREGATGHAKAKHKH
ncbi:hypothetical protein [Sphingomonas bacterium]|uniref:hypothetical protein n=1 Tax=Sphingomonas bacterium TaxID=1895847 RepID=UPI001575D039|nr:hypothetical protein [Sphingomonas bacterium]